jgi:hypothetical protein
MKVTIRVWGYYDSQSRTPLLAKDTIEVPGYPEARQAVTDKLKDTPGGHKAHGDCDGPNQNYNSIHKTIGG